MLKLTADQKIQFADAVHAAMRLAEIARIDEIYSRFEREREARSPNCDLSGRCCRFETFGHRLFVSTLEVARFRQRVDHPHPSGWDGMGCPFQVNGLCGVHRARPFGCRVYFCDPTSTAWQQEQYERFHREIRELHGLLGVEYLYAEWREALASLGVLPDKVGGSCRLLPVLPG